jgi:hypothetical protein
VLGSAADVIGVVGTSTNSIGVYGQAGEPRPLLLPTTGLDVAGVLGASNESTGVLGMSYGNPGVWGISTGNAVFGLSYMESGVVGVCSVDGPQVPNTSNSAGVVGSSDQQHGVIGTSNASVGVIGFSNNIGVLGYTATPGALAGQFIGDVEIDGNLTVAGGFNLKGCAVPFPDGTHRTLYCMESPEVWFEDFGAAKLKRGRVTVKLDADFAKVIKRGEYKVFLTPEGDCRGLYVRRKSAASFEVRELMGGKSAIAFSYRIVGRRKDVRGHKRFAKFDMRLPLPAAATRAARKPTRAELRAFIARVGKVVRASKGAKRLRARRGLLRPR